MTSLVILSGVDLSTACSSPRKSGQFNIYYHTTTKQSQRTFDEVSDGWAMVVGVEWLSGANLTDSCQQVVRFVGLGWGFFIELVELHMFVIIMWMALEATLIKFNMLRGGNLCQYFVK